MNLKIKVCGMRDSQNIRELVALAPDFIGFIFYPMSKRYVNERLDAALLTAIPESILKVGVFVNESFETIQEKMQFYHLDMAQLHGDESVEDCAKVASLGISVIKAFGVDQHTDFAHIHSYDAVVDYFLFDTKGDGYGGHGITFEWSLLQQYTGTKPFFLSGGLEGTAIQTLSNFKHPKLFAVDINSKFEVAPGLKNIQRIKDELITPLRSNNI